MAVNNRNLKKTLIFKANVTNETKVLDYYYAVPGSRRGLDVLGLVLFCATFGAVLASLGEKGVPMIVFFEILNECSLKIIRYIMWYFFNK